MTAGGQPRAEAALAAVLDLGAPVLPQPEVVIVMGVQGAGKSTLVNAYVDAGYERLNRDLLGGNLEDLNDALF